MILTICLVWLLLFMAALGGAAIATNLERAGVIRSDVPFFCCVWTSVGIIPPITLILLIWIGTNALEALAEVLMYKCRRTPRMA